MSDRAITEERVGEEHLGEVNPPAHWIYVFAVVGGQHDLDDRVHRAAGRRLLASGGRVVWKLPLDIVGVGASQPNFWRTVGVARGGGALTSRPGARRSTYSATTSGATGRQKQ